MKMSATTVRRGLYGMFAGGLLAFGSAAIVVPAATAEPAPSPGANCTVSAIANASSTVSASTSTYLASHPQTDDALSQIAKESPDQATDAYRTYFAENPQVRNELKTIHQPVTNVSSQCGVKVNPTPISEALAGL
jgi:hemophore-related protein